MMIIHCDECDVMLYSVNKLLLYMVFIVSHFLFKTIFNSVT